MWCPLWEKVGLGPLRNVFGFWNKPRKQSKKSSQRLAPGYTCTRWHSRIMPCFFKWSEHEETSLFLPLSFTLIAIKTSSRLGRVRTSRRPKNRNQALACLSYALAHRTRVPRQPQSIADCPDGWGKWAAPGRKSHKPSIWYIRHLLDFSQALETPTSLRHFLVGPLSLYSSTQ